MLLLNNRRGYLQIDFFFTMLFFIILFSTIYAAHNSYMKSYEDDAEQKELDITAQDICVLLSSYEGSPNNWEGDILNAEILGLKSSSNLYLDQSKVLEFFDELNYGEVVEKLDVVGVLYVSMVNPKTNLILEETGESYRVSSQVGRARCYQMYRGDQVYFDVEVWR